MQDIDLKGSDDSVTKHNSGTSNAVKSNEELRAEHDECDEDKGQQLGRPQEEEGKEKETSTDASPLYGSNCTQLSITSSEILLFLFEQRFPLLDIYCFWQQGSGFSSGRPQISLRAPQANTN